MKRYKKIISMLLLLILALTQLTTYAAIVSDNDGSAFVTKAEFEGLKKSFSEQVDNYNTSIDNKIDGAIAGYLAGLVSKKTIVDLPYADWEKVTSLNYALENDYWYPNVSLTVAHLAGMMYDLEITTNPIRFGYENWWAFAQLLYDRPSKDYYVMQETSQILIQIILFGEVLRKIILITSHCQEHIIVELMGIMKDICGAL